MNLSALTALSPLDGRYAKAVDPLRPYFSEHALIGYRVRIELVQLFSHLKDSELKEVAARCKPATTAQTIGRLETGTRNLSLVWMNRIAAALGVDPELLVRGEQAGGGGVAGPLAQVVDGALRVQDGDVGIDSRHGRQKLAGERALDETDPGIDPREVRAQVAPQDGAGEPGRSGRGWPCPRSASTAS